MIDALDCITLVARSPDAALQDYATLLGRSPLPAEPIFDAGNVRLQVIQNPALGDNGLAELIFAVADLSKAHSLLQRRALRAELGKANGGQRLHLGTDSTHGVPMSVIARGPGRGIQVAANEASVVSGLDHVVVRTPNPERAVALYAGRLGLSLRLDRTEPSWGARLLFFRCGDLIVEVAHDLKTTASDGPDKLWGLSWRVPDVDAANTRLRAAGVEVSEVRAGRRPGTQLFTVRSHTAGVPTIIIGPAKPQA